jgi:hypothetical protein
MGPAGKYCCGLTTVRFGEDQIRYEPEYVRRTLATAIARLSG